MERWKKNKEIIKFYNMEFMIEYKYLTSIYYFIVCPIKVWNDKSYSFLNKEKYVWIEKPTKKQKEVLFSGKYENLSNGWEDKIKIYNELETCDLYLISEIFQRKIKPFCENDYKEWCVKNNIKMKK